MWPFPIESGGDGHREFTAVASKGPVNRLGTIPGLAGALTLRVDADDDPIIARDPSGARRGLTGSRGEILGPTGSGEITALEVFQVTWLLN